MAEDTLIDRIERRAEEVGMSPRALSMLVTGKPDLLRDMRRRDTTPRHDTLAAIADALETTIDYLRFGHQGATVSDRRTGYHPAPADAGGQMPRNLPVYGTALGGDLQIEGEASIETHLVELTDAIDWIRRPPMLTGRRDVFALYITGSSMEPRFEPGDPVIVDPKRPPRPGDDVIVQFNSGESDAVQGSLVKRLVRRSAEFVELRQYNPPATFRVPLSRIVAIQRVLMLRDLLG